MKISKPKLLLRSLNPEGKIHIYQFRSTHKPSASSRLFIVSCLGIVELKQSISLCGIKTNFGIPRQGTERSY